MVRQYHEIDPDDEFEPEEVQEAAGFLAKMDWEGGLTSLLAYGGAGVFPAELQREAAEVDAGIESLRQAVQAWANERGVAY